MTGRRVLLALAVVLSLTAWLAAPVAAQKRGGTIVVGNDDDAVGLDPHLSFAFASANFYEHAYTGLTRFNAKMEIAHRDDRLSAKRDRKNLRQSMDRDRCISHDEFRSLALSPVQELRIACACEYAPAIRFA